MSLRPELSNVYPVQVSTGRLVILSGPSGVGKDTVINAWQQVNPLVRRVVAYTTRATRPGEVDGDDYHFVSQAAFQAMAEAGDFLEYKNVHGNYYATPLRDMERMLSEGLVAILKIDVQGAMAARDARPDALLIFLMPPSDEALAARIRGRGTEDSETIQRRLDEAHREIAMAAEYDYRVVNDDIGEVVKQLQKIVS